MTQLLLQTKQFIYNSKLRVSWAGDKFNADDQQKTSLFIKKKTEKTKGNSFQKLLKFN